MNPASDEGFRGGGEGQKESSRKALQDIGFQVF